ncbi:MAG TPA: glycoside hydrolase family 43 protein [Candidatus Onthomonas avicola]|nr:glycoside hydrolase family 43 protein [Candidatus Onthomonas avicola]
MNTFTNPILSGFRPDPSICRVGEDYYLVTSSFAYFPGLPVYHSRDLVHWEQIGHAIDRPGQLDYRNCEVKEGLWAPTIRHHDGVWYIVNTLVSDHYQSWRNFILTARDPAGPWSDPVFLDGLGGIDPSLFFGADGALWYLGSDAQEPSAYPGHNILYLQPLDRTTFQPAGERHILLDGADFHGNWIEAPHLYEHDGWYILIFAEGGTYRDHSVMAARSRALTGPYELCPRNPIVTHRHLPYQSELSVVGHADLVETQNGDWWAALLAVRPYEGGGYTLGRETCLLPMDWSEDGWPMAASRDGLVHRRERAPRLPETFLPLPCPADSFEAPTLGPVWNTIHPSSEPFWSLSARPGCLRLSLRPETLEASGATPAFVGRRQEHRLCLAVTAMDFTPQTAGEEAGLALFADCEYHFLLCKALHEGREALQLWQTEAGVRTLLAEQTVTPGARLYLAAQCNRSRYVLSWGHRPDRLTPLAEVNADLLSTTTNGGFTGTYFGLYASANGAPSSNHADFDWFSYHGIDI